MSHLLGESVYLWMPELFLSIGALGVMLLGAFQRPAQQTVESSESAPSLINLLTGVSIASAATALWSTTTLSWREGFFGLIIFDQLSLVFRWLALGTIAMVTMMAASSRDVSRAWLGEYQGLLLVVGVGLMAMAQANHLLMAYLALETVSLTSYLLVALTRDQRSSEASLKYLLFGAMSSGIMLFGMSLLYGMTGQLGFRHLQQAVQMLEPSLASLGAVAMSLVLAGLAFKISMVPFHMWTPDVYEGAPIPVTAMLSVGPKAAGLALLVRLSDVFGPMWQAAVPLLCVLTVVTMTLGNVVALVQGNVKRLLAYSTIGQVGYLLIGFVVNTTLGLEALLLYLVAYLFMNLGAFACVVAVVNDTRSESLPAFRGLARRAPLLAFGCTLFLLSLAGIPPLLGFLGKFLLFGSAIQANLTGLAIAGVLNSAVALYYYVLIIRQMYLEAPDSPLVLRPSMPLRVAVAVCAVATLGFGLFPNALLHAIQSVVIGPLLFIG